MAKFTIISIKLLLIYRKTGDIICKSTIFQRTRSRQITIDKQDGNVVIGTTFILAQ